MILNSLFFYFFIFCNIWGLLFILIEKENILLKTCNQFLLSLYVYSGMSQFMQEEHVQFVKECFHFSSIHEDGNSKRHICHRPCSCLLFFYCNKISLGCLLFPLNTFSCNPLGKSQTQPTDSSSLLAKKKKRVLN